MNAGAMLRGRERHDSGREMQHRPYVRFAVMMVGSFVAMYVLMYAMVSELPNAVPNLNQAYMAALMVAAMMAIEVVLMHGMYPSKAANAAIAVAGVVLLVAMWSAIRVQAGIGDRQFLKSMIPHHREPS